MPTPDEYAVEIRSLLNHESEVTHHRMSWLGTFQGFLFAALGVSWGKQGSKYLLLILASLGVGSTILGWSALFGSAVATKRIIQWWNTYKAGYAGPPVIGYELKPEATLARYLFTPWANMILLFVAAWIAVLFILVR